MIGDAADHEVTLKYGLKLASDVRAGDRRLIIFAKGSGKRGESCLQSVFSENLVLWSVFEHDTGSLFERGGRFKSRQVESSSLSI